MAELWIAALAAVFVWWFSTGAILYVVKRSEFRRSTWRLGVVAVGFPLAILGGLAIAETASSADIWSVYVAFLAAIIIWGWFELAFLMGVLTGPVVRPCPPSISMAERFIRAWGTIAYSNMALGATLAGLMLLTWGEANQFGAWTFALLFFARLSAQLNLHFGVPNVNLEFLPDPMRHLESHFRVAPMTPLFPVSATLLTLAVACWLERVYAAPSGSGTEIGFVLLTAMTVLALLEHWMMVLPMGDARLWRWMISAKPAGQRSSQKTTEPTLGENVHGL